MPAYIEGKAARNIPQDGDEADKKDRSLQKADAEIGRQLGQVARVLVDDNYRVKKGDVLVELDREPYQVQVAIKQAMVDTVQANLVMAQASVRGLLGQTRSQRFKLTRAIEDVDNQIALVRARVATWEQSKATLVLAQAEFNRAERLLATKVVSAEDN